MTMTPEQERLEVYQAVGLAISQWNHVEQAVFEIFCRFLDCKNWLAASAAFYTTISFATRLKMTDHAAGVCPTDPKLKEEWKKLSRRVSRRKDTRNNLVHFSVVTHTAGEKQPGKRVELIPGILNLPATLKKKQRNYRLNEIKLAASAFGRLAGDPITFHQKL